MKKNNNIKLEKISIIDQGDVDYIRCNPEIQFILTVFGEIPPSVLLEETLEFKNIIELNIVYVFDLIQVPEVFTRFQNLRSISLSGTNFSYFPDNINNWTNLNNISVSGTPILHLPKYMRKFESLESIQILLGGKLTNLPDEITSLACLKSLSIFCNELKKIPENIGNLKNLEELNLAGNLLKEVPDSMFSLPYLKYVDLSKNNLSDFNLDNILSLGTIVEIDLTENDFSEEFKKEAFEKFLNSKIQLFI